MDWAGILGDALRTAFGPLAASYALAAIGLNMHYGYTGLLNFGHVGYMLVGAYGMGITTVTLGWSLWLGIPIGILAAVALSFLLGLPTLRLRADYFAIATIAVAEVLRLVVQSGSSSAVTGGPLGLQSVAGEFYALNPFPSGRYGIGTIEYGSAIFWPMLVTWALVGLVTLAMYLLMRSPWGRVIRSIREDEDAARSLGKNVFNYKMQALVIGGVIGALGGIMYSILSTSVNPLTWLPIVTFYLYTLLIMGGAASLAGPIVGAILFWFALSGVDAALRDAASQNLLPGFLAESSALGAARFILVGALLVLLMAFRPQGLFGNRRELQLDA